jgi:CRP/FNR family transcriptional regulator, anaerobic regulatory protein
MNNALLSQVYQHPLFKASDLEIIFKAHTKIHLKKGEFILKESDISDAYYILETGMIRSYVLDNENNEITTNFYCDNEIAIEVLSLFKRIPSQENMHALTDCIAWKIEYDTFQKFFESIPGFTEWGRSWFTMALFATKQHSLSMIMHTAKDRYLQLIKLKPIVAQQAPLKYIATYLGITDTSLSRIRKEIMD